VHTSNLYFIPRQAELAAELLPTCELDKAFFCNSGAEAIECSLKLARKWGKLERGGASKIVATHGSFHGRTMGAVTVTGQPKYHEPFTPLLPGVCHVAYGDIGALAAAVDDETAAVLLEPIQGESGVRVPPAGYLPAVRRLCDEHRVVLILDEVQTGLGRTGDWYAHQHDGVVPDVMALAKSLGGGFPIGACLARAPYCDVLQPGDHASTFGGNPLASAAGVAFLRTMKAQGIVEHSAEVGRYAVDRLGALSGVTEVRGRGLMIGLDIANGKAQEVNAALFRRRVLANAIGEDTLRILPPLIITEAEIDRFLVALEESLLDAGAA
jgi:acetylornithine/succinyldiaminopimelate/putrescine aminotransferase